jgi:glycerophosphoryl diester phosphodiesterase
VSGWTGVRVIAHRCGGRLAPENTLAGLRMAAARGIAAVEFDVMLSADRAPFLIHDEGLERTTAARGAVAETSAAVLAAIRANRGRETEFPDELLPRFGDAAVLCRRLGLLANVEIKPAAGHDAETGRVVAAAAAQLWADAPVPPLLSSFSLAALGAARQTAPQVPCALLVDPVPADWRGLLAELGCVALHVNERKVTPGLLDVARAAGVPVRCYTVNSAARASELMSLGVASVFTDAIDECFAI